MIQAIIIDDKNQDRQELQELLDSHCPDVWVVGDCVGLAEARQLIHKHSPELVFLELDLPGGSGFSLLENGGVGEAQVVLLSSQGKHARRAFKTKALHYLLKPIRPQDLKEAVGRVKREIQAHQHNQALSKERVVIPTRMRFPTVDGFLVANTADISHLTAAGRKCALHFKDGSQAEVNCKFGDCAKRFDNIPFARVHRSMIVNMRFVKVYKKGQENLLILEGDVQVPVGKNYKGNVQCVLSRLGLLPS